MRKIPVALTCLAFSLPCFCFAQQTDSGLPDAPVPAVHDTTHPAYSPPTQEQRFRSYLRQTYGLGSLVEAGARAGIDQARDHPSEWPEGAEGYGDRFGSAMGEIIVRETTEYMFADLFHENIRRIPCKRPCTQSKFKLAFEDSFLARHGEDGHESVSVAHLIGPFSGNIVATNTWYPAGTTKADTAKGVGLTYGLVYVRNLVHEFIGH